MWSPVYPFVVPVVPSVRILESEAQFELLSTKVTFPLSLINVEYFEAFLNHLHSVAFPPSERNITLFFGTMNSSIPRSIPLGLRVCLCCIAIISVPGIGIYIPPPVVTRSPHSLNYGC